MIVDPDGRRSLIFASDHPAFRRLADADPSSEDVSSAIRTLNGTLTRVLSELRELNQSVTM